MAEPAQKTKLLTEPEPGDPRQFDHIGLFVAADHDLEHLKASKKYRKVVLVRCSVCGSDLCAYVHDPTQIARNKGRGLHPEGLRRIVFHGSPLLSSRLRLDGVMGHECMCGTESLMNPIEQEVIDPDDSRKLPPDVARQLGKRIPKRSLTDYDRLKIKDKMIEEGWQKPKPVDEEPTARGKSAQRIASFVEEQLK